MDNELKYKVAGCWTGGLILWNSFGDVMSHRNFAGQVLFPVFLVVACCLPLSAQSAKDKQSEIKRTWRVGAEITGPNRPITNILLTFPIPTDWPEQHVNVYQENIPDEARRAEFRDSDGVRQMVAHFPRVNARSSVNINVIVDITVSAVEYPERTDHLVIPERPPRNVRFHLNPSPLIERRARNIKNKVKELVEGVDLPWEQVRCLYDFVTTEIEVEGRKVIGAELTLKEMKGSAEDRSNLFIAMCRAHKVPARMVWANNGEYAEFYLQDDEGHGQWYPAVLEGSVEFGQMTNPRVIIQKGDNIKVAEKSQRQRFVTEHIRGSGAGGARPRVRFLREELPARERMSLEKAKNDTSGQ